MVPQNSPRSSCKWLRRGQKWGRLAGPFLGPQKSKIRPNLIETRITQVATYRMHLGNWGGPTNGDARFSTFYGSRNGPLGNAILWSLAVSLFRSFHQCQWSRCGHVVVPLWSRCGPAALLQFTIQTSWCGLVVVSLFKASTNVSDVLRSLGDSGNYNTIERVPTPYLPNQPLRILVQNFSQVPRCKVFFQSMQHRAVSHQQLLPLRKHSKKSQASFTNQECLSSQPPEEQDDSQIEAGFTITPHPAPPNMSNPPSRRRTRWQLNRSSLHNHTIRFFLFSKDSKKFSQLRHTN